MISDKKIFRALLTLVRAGLWLTPPDDPDSLCLDAEQWGEVMRLAGDHSICGLVSQGLDQIEDDTLLPPRSVRTRLALDVYRYEKQYRHMLQVASDLFEEFESEGLHPVLQKGAAVAALYEHPEFRPSGDVDIWFAPDELERAVPQGAQPSSDGGYVFSKDDVDIELHSVLVDVAAPSHKRYVARLISKEGFCSCGAGLRSTTPLATMLILDTHILKHMFGWGAGLRQICDYAKARAVLCYDEAAWEEAVSGLGLRRWTSILDRLCDEFLCSAHADGHDGQVEDLLERILLSGTFGGGSRAGRSTFGAFLSSFCFSVSVAPVEWFWTVLSLMRGKIAKTLKFFK